MEALTRDFQDLLALLDKHGVRFMVVGGYAVAAHGELGVAHRTDPQAQADRTATFC